MTAPATREEIEAAVAAAIVKWLRTEHERVMAIVGRSDPETDMVAAHLWSRAMAYDTAADAIERGAHRENRDGE
jgi:hypothetical protein